MPIQIGVDTGGTFTDVVMMDGSRSLHVFKVPSTPADPCVAIFHALERALSETAGSIEDVSHFIHGTTVGTNAILEGKHARVALITTRGFRDVLQIARQERPVMFDFFAYRAEPLVPRKHRYEVSERIAPDGTVREELDEAAARAVLDEISRQGIKAVAVCFLHSYANPAHEQSVERIAREEFPELSITISSSIVNEFKEYERASTSVLNACIQPFVRRYMSRLQGDLQLRGLRSRVHVMQSNGGVMTAETAGIKSVQTVLSGPAGGALAAQHYGTLAGYEDVIGIDMGGTSLDVSLTHKGRLSLVNESEIAGHVVKLSMIGIHTLGAGGGSIAWIDAGQGLRVGPHSAGAEPGPVCYGKGGVAPTVTDANLVLGRVASLLGGEMTVAADAARRAMRDRIAGPLGLTVEEAAEGIIRIVNADMAKGMRYVSLERGFDPRTFALVAFGGAGPAHASELAAELRIPTVIVPPTPGAHSALGLLLTDIRLAFSRTVLCRTASMDVALLKEWFDQLTAEALRQLAQEGVPPERSRLVGSIDLRYVGQGFDLSVGLPNTDVNGQTLTLVEKAYHELHRQSYGFCKPDEPTEIVTLRLMALGVLDKPELPRAPEVAPDPGEALTGTRRVYYGGTWYDARLYARGLLKPGMIVHGPAIMEQRDSTTVIWPDQITTVDPWANLVITGAAGN